MTKEEVKECVENLCIKLTIVENNRLLYKELTKLVGKGKQYECILKASICFWTLTVSNLRYSLFSELAKLYDEQKDSFGIKKLINVCSQNSDWFSEGCDEYEITHIELMRELESEYASTRDMRRRLKGIRDSELAHNDLKKLLSKEYVCEDVTWGDVEDLIQTAYKIMNSISLGMADSFKIIELSNYNDVGFMIKNAYKGMLEPD